MRTLKSFNFKDKRVLVRCDFNVPLDKQGNIVDDFRIKKTIPTIEYLIKKGAKLLLMSHLGRPGGKVIESLRLRPVQDKLMEYLDVSITKARDCIGEEVEDWIGQMQPGEILLLENLRFHKEEEANGENFAKELSRLGDIYINDAFGACHRPHASIVGLPKYLPCGAGLLLEKEVRVLEGLIQRAKKPLVAIIGGKKVETRLKLINAICEIADLVLINCLMAIELKKKRKNIQLKCPQKIIASVDAAKENMDIGEKTIKLFKEKISRAKTIFWSGPLGAIEKEEFSNGSREIAKAIIESRAFSVVGGGETVKFVNKLSLASKFNHLSTGGGAMLDFIVDGELVGIEALR